MLRFRSRQLPLCRVIKPTFAIMALPLLGFQAIPAKPLFIHLLTKYMLGAFSVPGKRDKALPQRSEHPRDIGWNVNGVRVENPLLSPPTASYVLAKRGELSKVVSSR